MATQQLSGKYVDDYYSSSSEDINRLRQLLQCASADTRYSLLKDVRSSYGETAVYKGAYENLESIKTDIRANI